MKLLLSLLLLAWVLAVLGAAEAANQRPNVLFLAVDDLNDWVGCMGGHSQAKTPNIDRLASRGTLFLNAHAQSPLCNPSRASLLTGLRPSTTGIYGLTPGIRDVERTKWAVTLPQYFGRQGYFTFTCGKVFHDGSIAPGMRTNEFDVWGPAPGMPRPAQKFVETPENHPAVDWGVFPPRDEDQADWKIASAAIEQIRAAAKDRPWFIACGFRLPHVPCYASQKWFDLHPEADVKVPAVMENDREDTPEFSWYLHWKLPEPRLSWLKRSGQWRPLVRAYLAATTFMDSQVGRVLEALEASGQRENTVVVLWSDNGWHLGEKGITGKNSLWDRSTRVPLVFAGPGIANGGRCRQPAELLDIYPTLVELCRLPAKTSLEGHSLLAQLKDPQAPRTWPAITTHNPNNHGIRTDRWRYVRYADGSEELYDMQADPNEWTNLAKVNKQARVLARLRRWLPQVNLALAPGSTQRVLTYDPATREAVWEGKRIVASEKEE